MLPGPDDRFGHITKALARPQDLRRLPMPAMHVVMAMRLCALFERAGRDPFSELATRFASAALAVDVLSLNRRIARSWPDAFVVSRPCCMRLTPDEATLANLARFALAADRQAFARELEGFVRTMFHDGLYEQLLSIVAQLSELQHRA